MKSDFMFLKTPIWFDLYLTFRIIYKLVILTRFFITIFIQKGFELFCIMKLNNLIIFYLFKINLKNSNKQICFPQMD